MAERQAVIVRRVAGETILVYTHVQTGNEKLLKCRVCNEPLHSHVVVDTEAVAMLECPTGDRRVILFVSPA